MDPYDLINSDDQELKVTLKSAAVPGTTATLALWCVDCDKSPGTTETVDQWLSQGSDGHFGQTTQGLTYYQTKSLEANGLTTFEIGRNHTIVAMEAVRLFGVGQLKGTTVVETVPPTRVRFVPRPNLLRILEGNVQLAAPGETFENRLRVGLYRNPFDDDGIVKTSLIPIPGQALEFRANAPEFVALVAGGITRTIRTRTDEHGGATVTATAVAPVFPNDQELYRSSLTPMAVVRAAVTGTTISVRIVDGDEFIECRGINERYILDRPEYPSDYDRSQIQKNAEWLRLDAGNWGPMESNTVGFNLASVDRHVPRTVYVDVFVTDAARTAICTFNSWVDMQLSPIDGVGYSGSPTSAFLPLNESIVMQAALTSATSIFTNLGDIRFGRVVSLDAQRPATDHLAVVVLSVHQGSSDLPLTAGAVDPLASVSLGTPTTRYAGITYPPDFEADEPGNWYQFAAATNPRSHACRIYVESYSRRMADQLPDGGNEIETTLGAKLGQTIAHEVGHALGLVVPQLFGPAGCHTPNRIGRSVDNLTGATQAEIDRYGLDLMSTKDDETWLNEFNKSYLRIVLPARRD